MTDQMNKFDESAKCHNSAVEMGELRSEAEKKIARMVRRIGSFCLGAMIGYYVYSDLPLDAEEETDD